MNRADIAEENFRNGLNCAQSVFMAFSGEFGIEADTAESIARGFGGGMATGDTCGTVSGAIMVIGLFVRKDRDGDREAAKKRTHELVVEFKERFSKETGSLACRDLLGYDLNDRIAVKAMPEDRLPKVVCVNYVRLAAGILEELLKI